MSQAISYRTKPSPIANHVTTNAENIASSRPERRVGAPALLFVDVVTAAPAAVVVPAGAAVVPDVAVAGGAAVAGPPPPPPQKIVESRSNSLSVKP